MSATDIKDDSEDLESSPSTLDISNDAKDLDKVPSSPFVFYNDAKDIDMALSPLEELKAIKTMHIAVIILLAPSLFAEVTYVHVGTRR